MRKSIVPNTHQESTSRLARNPSRTVPDENFILLILHKRFRLALPAPVRHPGATSGDVTGASNGCGRTRVGRSQVGLIRANLNRFNRHVTACIPVVHRSLVDGSVRFSE